MSLRKLFGSTGPGLIIAATGLGAGDIVAAAVAGAQFGTTLLWAVILGAVLKFCLNEGLARWQLVTDKTLLDGWVSYLPRLLSWYFLCYLVLWTFMVAAALMAATGLAAHAMIPGISVSTWGIIHSFVALVLVLRGGYHFLENMMKVFIGLMFMTILCCAVLVLPEAGALFDGIFMPSLPSGSVISVLSIVGGVGGSVTILSYGYWMREAGWRSPADLAAMRLDLCIAYGITCLFGMAIIVISAGVKPELVTGNNMALAIAQELGDILGNPAKWIFLIGFWGAVFSSMLGVWHGVPYLFADLYSRLWADVRANKAAKKDVKGTWSAYRCYLIYLSILPMSLLALDRPVWLIVLYALTGAAFMPLLAVLLLYMNSKRKWLGTYINGLFTKILLVICVILFGFLLFQQIQTRLGG